MKNKIILFLWLIILSIFWNNTVFSAENKINIQSEELDLMKIIEVSWKKVIIHGDISFPNWIDIPYDLHVEWDLKIGSNVTLLWNITVDGDVVLWNRVRLYKSLEWKNIITGNYLVANKIIAHENLKFHGFAKIKEGVEVWGDFDSGSDLILQGNSKILWNVKLWKDVTISGIFYVYWSMNGNYDFIFRWDKFRIVWNFKTQNTSSLIGKLYLFAKTWHRTLYGNRTIRYRYVFKNTQYNGIMKGIDPLLNYKLTQDNIDVIHGVVVLFEREIKNQKAVIQKKYQSGKNELTIQREIQKLISIQQEMFSYISPYIEIENWDSRQWKILKIQEKTDLKKFVYQYVSGSEFDY